VRVYADALQDYLLLTVERDIWIDLTPANTDRAIEAVEQSDNNPRGLEE
jgi:hypothetical protein